MTAKISQPQMMQMNADIFLKFLICANLRNQGFTKALKEILENIGA